MTFNSTADTDRYFTCVACGDGVFVALTPPGRALADMHQTPSQTQDDTELVRNILGDAFYLLKHRSRR